MIEKRNFTTAEIIGALDELRIEYDFFGSALNNELHFCSLRKPEPNGIYFVEAQVDIKFDVAGSLFITSERMGYENCAELVVGNPQLTFYKLMDLFFNERDHTTGVHPTAVVDSDAVIDPKAWVGPYCVIGRAAIGAGVRLHSHIVVFDGTVIEDDVVIEPHSTIGATGVAWIWDPENGERVRQPQIGGVRIGKGCFLGSDITVVRGSANEITEIGAYTVIAHGTKIGHGCKIGSEVHCSSNVSLAGNVDVGKGAFLGVGCSIRPRITLAAGTVVGIGAAVVKNNNVPGVILSGVPARPSEKKGRMAGVPKLKNEVLEK
ncbi:MAG: hypothetical protein RPT25_11790 [Cycloclasticus sp.]